MHEGSTTRRMVCSSAGAGADLIDAKLETHKICGSVQCPSCGHTVHRKPDWVGLPAGVKFDPTDQELMDHLEAKVFLELSNSHPLIDEFIPTIDGEEGICYTHPEKLPGVTRDGLSKHFFHRPSKAYTTGTRKRRKIQTDSKGETRWHKTGKTRPVNVGGMQKGCKKILVLYTNFGKHRKPQKTNWVMHQYHLGELEEEKEGELVVSKIFFQTQPRQCNWPEKSAPRISASCSSKEVISQIDELNPAVVARIPALGSFDIHRGPGNFTKMVEPSPPQLTLPLSLPLTTTILQDEVDRNQKPATSFSLSPMAMLPEDPFHVSPLLNQQKLLERSNACLEELIMGMGCNPAAKRDHHGTLVVPHSQETEWQYSSPYWMPPDHHHQHQHR